MTYNASYDQDDLQPIIIDGMGTAGAGVVDLVPVILIVLLVVFLLGALAKVIKASR